MNLTKRIVALFAKVAHNCAPSADTTPKPVDPINGPDDRTSNPMPFPRPLQNLSLSQKTQNCQTNLDPRNLKTAQALNTNIPTEKAPLSRRPRQSARPHPAIADPGPSAPRLQPPPQIPIQRLPDKIQLA